MVFAVCYTVHVSTSQGGGHLFYVHTSDMTAEEIACFPSKYNIIVHVSAQLCGKKFMFACGLKAASSAHSPTHLSFFVLFVITYVHVIKECACVVMCVYLCVHACTSNRSIIMRTLLTMSASPCTSHLMLLSLQ